MELTTRARPRRPHDGVIILLRTTLVFMILLVVYGVLIVPCFYFARDQARIQATNDESTLRARHLVQIQQYENECGPIEWDKLNHAAMVIIRRTCNKTMDEYILTQQTALNTALRNVWLEYEQNLHKFFKVEIVSTIGYNGFNVVCFNFKEEYTDSFCHHIVATLGSAPASEPIYRITFGLAVVSCIFAGLMFALEYRKKLVAERLTNTLYEYHTTNGTYSSLALKKIV